ncbi:hypothetical protein L596_019237 [Steinernema carpocapsae]|uniref:mannose-6-phosphate isomerase n=1 Tax=Steinernema carpocapsae TaxID=34508 RepID=A0A4U5MPU7_STECR|nr:hypothetical protein L596_019237 [Steinernema carpocapsae]
MLRLSCCSQNYPWGKIGASSEVAKLALEPIDGSKPYAELWMGVHPNGPSKIRESGEPLQGFLQKNPEALGTHEEGTLQFLFKVLSVNKALSVQSHPTKDQAKGLHAKDLKNYPDPNHKPEMAIALTDFQLLCGFREPAEIHANISGCPELQGLLKPEDVAQLKVAGSEKAGLQVLFRTMMTSPVDTVASAVAQMAERLKQKSDRTALEDLLVRLSEEYPGDVGVFAPLWLNYFTLKSGESTFLGPNEPHAYLLGDCIECMACSDNTIRAGLTPKYKDVETLCTNLTYRTGGPPRFQSKQLAEGIVEYAPPVPEFTVHEITAPAKRVPVVGAGSILIVVAGSAKIDGEEAKPGFIFFLRADLNDLKVAEVSADFKAFRAFTPRP